jgi:hypothetical protein
MLEEGFADFCGRLSKKEKMEKSRKNTELRSYKDGKSLTETKEIMRDEFIGDARYIGQLVAIDQGRQKT